MNKKIVRVGIGALIFNNGKVLLGKRKGSYGENSWCLPGGHLEFGESFEEGIKREVKEETGLNIKLKKIISVSNEIVYNKHFITVSAEAEIIDGEVRLMEPENFEKWDWFDLNNLPDPMFIPSKIVIDNFLNKNIISEYNEVS